MSLPTLRPDLSFDENAAPSEAVCARAVVQRARWVTGLSQAAFAERYAIDPEALHEVECGRQRPDPSLLARLRMIVGPRQAAPFVARGL